MQNIKKLENMKRNCICEKRSKTGPWRDRTRDPLKHLGTGNAFTTTPCVHPCLKTGSSKRKTSVISWSPRPRAKLHRPRFEFLKLASAIVRRYRPWKIGKSSTHNINNF